MIPVSTSLLPAVAIPSLPEELKQIVPSGRETAVFAPFRQTISLLFIENSRNNTNFSKSLSHDLPIRFLNSFGCGVRIEFSGIFFVTNCTCSVEKFHSLLT